MNGLVPILCSISLIVAGVAIYGTYSVWRLPPPSLDGRSVEKWSPAIGSLIAESERPGEMRPFAQTFARPLFNPTRRPLEERVVSAAPPADLPTLPESLPPFDSNQLSLKGILIVEDRGHALIASPELPDGKWVTVGDEVMGWKVSAMHDDHVELAINGQRALIKLYRDRQAD